mgnify:CR=1 FL=1
MRRVPWVALLWPGLPYILGSASVRALGVSIAAAAMLNLLLAATFLWDELLAATARNWGWIALAFFWMAAAMVFVVQRWWGQTATDCDALAGFQEALEHYLRGDWFKTERLLFAILKANPEDVEARLLLATLFRHTGRRDEARSELQRLAEIPGASAWQWEIGRELALLANGSDAATSDAPSTETVAHVKSETFIPTGGAEIASPVEQGVRDPAAVSQDLQAA